jgi:GDSL-like Lipase/Acylhydrolase
MARRQVTRAWGWEPLEERIAMSHEVSSPGGFGAVGDSLTDEYRFYPPDQSQARNWVEILSQTRKLDFGAFTTRSRGLPRNQGFANDWALSGATSQGVVGGQLPGLAAQVASGKVKYASVNEGSNDFLAFLEQTAVGLPIVGIPPSYLSDLYAVEVNAQNNFDTTVNTLLAANKDAKVVVSTINDLHQVPIVAQFLGNPAAKLVVDAAEDAVQAFNVHVRLVAAAHHSRVAVSDLAAQSAAIAGLSSVPFGGTTINLATTGDNYHDFVLADEIHPGTVAQGEIANAFINAVDTLGLHIKPLSPAEILKFARMTPGQLARTP